MAFQGNYFNPMQNNPYGFNNIYQQPIMQPQMQQPVQQASQTYRQPIGLQGKIVENLEVAKVADIPLDGSTSYLVIADGSGIVTKQLQNDGTSKTIVYKPVDSAEESKEQIKFVTHDELESKIKNLNSAGVKDDIKAIKKQIRDILKEIEDINEDRKD